MLDKICISFIIPTWNRQFFLERALNSIRKAKKNYMVEVIVVDNYSKVSASAEGFEDLDVTLIRLDENYGPSIARNRGIQCAKYELILPLDDDDEITENGIDIIAKTLNENKELIEKFPVICFANNYSKLKSSFHLYDLNDYLASNYGDISAVIIKKKWINCGLQYPCLKIGGESLLWMKIAQDYMIPIFSKVIQKVNVDSPIRLTNTTNQLCRAREYMVYQEKIISIIEDKRKQLRPFFHKKVLGYTIYAVLCSQEKEAFQFLKNQDLSILFFMKNIFLLLLPRHLIVFLLQLYRRLDA